MARLWALLVVLLACRLAQASDYVPEGECDGLPRLRLEVPQGFCVGLVASGLKYPRGIVVLPSGDLLVTDMMGWVANRGRLVELKRQGGKYVPRVLLRKLDRPHGLAIGPDGKIYVGVVGRILRFDLADPHQQEDVIGGNSEVPALPNTGRHNLVSFQFHSDGDLLVTVGSATDNCEASAADKLCPEAEGNEARGVIRRYTMHWPAGTVSGSAILARGLRNAMALASHDSGRILAVDNGRDGLKFKLPGLASDDDLPHERLVEVGGGTHFGWPYCYDDAQPSPEFPAVDCRRFGKSLRLLPGHAAPLGMAYYRARRFPAEFHGALIIGYHGYRSNGHRIVAFRANRAGLPLGNATTLVGGWEAMPGVRPLGAPVAFAIGPDGALDFTEDRNGTVLRLSYCGERSCRAQAGAER